MLATMDTLQFRLPGWSPVSKARDQVCCSLDRQVRRSEEHTSELQSQSNLVCRLLLEKKKHNEEQPAPAGTHSGTLRTSDACVPCTSDAAPSSLPQTSCPCTPHPRRTR